MAKAFREQLQVDLATMMNPEEFGVEVVMDGTPLMCSEETDMGEPYHYQEEVLGLNTGRRRLIFRALDLSVIPPVGAKVTLDDEYWYVAEVKRPLGQVAILFMRVE